MRCVFLSRISGGLAQPDRGSSGEEAESAEYTAASCRPAEQHSTTLALTIVKIYVVVSEFSEAVLLHQICRQHDACRRNVVALEITVFVGKTMRL
jgi:hypothetical protein